MEVIEINFARSWWRIPFIRYEDKKNTETK